MQKQVANYALQLLGSASAAGDWGPHLFDRAAIQDEVKLSVAAVVNTKVTGN